MARQSYCETIVGPRRSARRSVSKSVARPRRQLARLGLPPVAVTATAVDSTATPRQRAVEQRPVAWMREVLTGRYGQRHGRNGLLTGPRVENSLFEPFYAQNIIHIPTVKPMLSTKKASQLNSTESLRQLPQWCKDFVL
ncbi:hypothetical protein C8J57DRAFT_1231957 [Mycena rebaudengoi]|nr:hypothetical protein C8J57DRAFT_1231957 [Mycena rebaudengoi]